MIVVNDIYVQTMVTERNERTRAESGDSLQCENPGATDAPYLIEGILFISYSRALRIGRRCTPRSW